MNDAFISIYHEGLTGLLRIMSLDETVVYIHNHLHAFLLDETICLCFLQRLAADPATVKHPQPKRALLYLLDKALQFRPMRSGLLGAAVQISGDRQLARRLEFVEQHTHKKEAYDRLSSVDIRTQGDAVRNALIKLIADHPDHMAAAQFALHLDRQMGVAHGQWREIFQCPAPLRRLWEMALFNHHAALGDYETARTLWSGLKQDMLRETSMNLAAEMFIADDETTTGTDLYRRSLAMDPRQTPVKHRLQELESPLVPDSTLPDKCNVHICLYSWNKAEMLAQTLESLSHSSIGRSHIHILLNGCTDTSREVADSAVSLFPNNPVTIHDLHVNIGAPAARNWLLGLPEVRSADYAAFLDDDVSVPEHWLASFLTIAEQDDKIGAVGCKVVDPGDRPNLQYLYRHVGYADKGLLKMSLHAPLNTLDNHGYDYTRETRNVMGCLHLLRTSAVAAAGNGFDIRFSPSQIDDIDHDLSLCLAGYKVMYCGTVQCVHHQSSGVRFDPGADASGGAGNTLANEIKFFLKHAEQLDELRALDCLGIESGGEAPGF